MSRYEIRATNVNSRDLSAWRNKDLFVYRIDGQTFFNKSRDYSMYYLSKADVRRKNYLCRYSNDII